MNGFIGKTLGKVQIEALIGRGGAAEVYLGTHTTLERKVAVKIIRNLDDESSDKLDRFKREARVIAKLRHANIVQVYDFDTVDNCPYLVMEYVGGPSLSKYLNSLHQNYRRLPLPQIVRMIRAVASALQYAHNNGIVHRDVKPGNILLTSPSRSIEVGKPLPEDFEPVLTDFGLVRLMDSHRQTTTGHIAGTPAYMSPEQSRGEATDGRGDIYSLGIVLYEMLAGDVPFDGESTVSILLKQVSQPPPPIPRLSPLIQRVLDRALAKEVKDRYQTPIEFAEALGAAVAMVGMKNEADTMEFNEIPTILPSEALPPVEVKPQTKIDTPAESEQFMKPQTQIRWGRIAALAVIVMAFGGFLWINKGIPLLVPSANGTVTLPSSATYTITYTLLPATVTSTPTVVVPSGPTGVLHFQHGSALADQASFIAYAMPAPPPGYRYEVWLLGGSQRLSLGTFVPDRQGKGELTFSNSEGANLIASYSGMEVTLESDLDADSASSGLVVYTFILPQEELAHIRYLLSAYSQTPDQNALIQGLYSDVKQIAALAQEMQSASASSDQKTVKQKAETALNILVGAKSQYYKDWNGDGQKDPRKSYGLLINGDVPGYLQAVQIETNFIITNAPTEYTYLIDNGKAVQTCAQNISDWTPKLQELLLAILNASPDASTAEPVKELVSLTDQVFNGIDTDNSGKVDPVSGECGAAAVYEYAYHMADMPIMPAGLSEQLTQVADVITPGSTADGAQNSFGTPASAKATNTKKPPPTKKTVPTNSGGGNNGGGNSGGGGKPPPKKTPKK